MQYRMMPPHLVGNALGIEYKYIGDVISNLNYLPAKHGVHAEEDPTEVYCPAGHPLQKVCFLLGWKYPVGQL
jgi:hypothetical protein